VTHASVITAAIRFKLRLQVYQSTVLRPTSIACHVRIGLTEA